MITSNFLKNIDTAIQKQPRDFSAWAVVFLISFGVYLYLSSAFIGQNLHVWGDEVTYSAETRNINFSKSTYPVYLYLSLFSLAHSAGSSFLELARHINALLISLAVPFVYMTSRIYSSRRWSCLIAAIVGFSPITTYSAYFMPDAMFFSAFCIFSWFCLAKFRLENLLYGLGLGIFASALSMIKPHGIFVYFSFLGAQLIFALIMKRQISLTTCLKSLTISLTTFLFIRLVTGYFLAGSPSFLGAYSGWLTTDLSSQKISTAINLGITLTTGHLIALVVVTGPCILTLILPSALDEDGRKILSLKLYLIFSLVLMVTVSILFSIRIADGAPYADTTRLHMRYYNYLFPLLFIALTTQLQKIKITTFWTLFLTGLLAASSFSLLADSLAPFSFAPLDAPELSGISSNSILLKIIGVAVGITILIFSWRPSLAARIYIGLVLPFMAISGNAFVAHDLSDRLTDMPGDTAGKMVRQYFGSQSHRIGFFGDVNYINQAMFYAGGQNSYAHILNSGDPVPNLDSPIISPIKSSYSPITPIVPLNTIWIVVFGDRLVPSDYSVVLENAEWRLLRRDRGTPTGPAFDLTDKNWVGGIARNWAGFFVKNSAKSREIYKRGQTLRFADGQFRTVTSVTTSESYINVFLEGPPLDGSTVGHPKGIDSFN
jgi:hypothetical protein